MISGRTLFPLQRVSEIVSHWKFECSLYLESGDNENVPGEIRRTYKIGCRCENC